MGGWEAEGTSFQSRVEFQVDNAQLVRSTGVKVSVMALQGRKSSPQKSRPLESGHRRHAVWIAIEYSYKLGQESEFKFWCELGWFSQRQSHIVIKIYKYHGATLMVTVHVWCQTIGSNFVMAIVRIIAHSCHNLHPHCLTADRCNCLE